MGELTDRQVRDLLTDRQIEIGMDDHRSPREIAESLGIGVLPLGQTVELAELIDTSENFGEQLGSLMAQTGTSEIELAEEFDASLTIIRHWLNSMGAPQPSTRVAVIEFLLARRVDHLTKAEG